MPTVGSAIGRRRGQLYFLQLEEPADANGQLVHGEVVADIVPLIDLREFGAHPRATKYRDLGANTKGKSRIVSPKTTASWAVCP